MAAVILASVARQGRQQSCAILGGAYTNKRYQSDLTAYRRGRGGRSSFSGIVATVFGASGFLGRYVVNRLGKIGTQVIVPHRSDPYFVQRLKLAGDLGQILFYPFELRDEDSVRRALSRSNVVINLIGRDYETRNYTYEDVHVTGARTIARLARECGVQTLVHMSAMNASDDPQVIYMKDGCNWLKSKARGEEAVRQEFPDAIILRPTDVFGTEDRFILYYINSWRRSLGMMPMWKKGRATIKQPVFVSDVAQAVINAVQDVDAAGKTFEIAGPERFVLADLVDYLYKHMRWEEIEITNIFPGFWLKAAIMAMKPYEPTFCKDRIEREYITDVLTGCPTIADLGVDKLTSIIDRAAYEIRPYRRYNYYEADVGEFPTPSPPPLAQG